MGSKLSKGLMGAALLILAGLFTSINLTSNKMAEEFEPALQALVDNYLDFVTLQSVHYDRGFLFSTAKSVWFLDSDNHIEVQHEVTNWPFFATIKSVYKGGDSNLKFGLPKDSNVLLAETRIGPGASSRTDITVSDINLIEEDSMLSSKGVFAHFNTDYERFSGSATINSLAVNESGEEVSASGIKLLIEGDNHDLLDATLDISVGELLGNFAEGKQVSKGIFFKAGSVMEEGFVTFNYAVGMDEVSFVNEVLNISANSPVIDLAIKVNDELARALSDVTTDEQAIFNVVVHSKPEFIIKQFASTYSLNGDEGVFKVDGAITLDVPPEMIPQVVQNPFVLIQFIKGALNLDADRSLFSLGGGMMGADFTELLTESKIDPQKNGLVNIATESGVFSINGVPMQ